MNNPWKELNTLTRLRVKESIKYNAFWIVDALNQYGLMIQCDEDFTEPKREVKLKGIEIKLDNTSSPNQLILLLKDNKDWELFLVLCKDLINVMKEKDKDIIPNVMKRLVRWQKLLQRNSLKVVSKEEQMGLFGELTVLNDYLIPTYGYRDSIHSWVGALGDKQDFLLEKFAVEVKSHRITSGQTVWISSKEQLNSEKSPLYLFTCALNEVDNGVTIEELVQSIKSTISSELILDEFIEKLESYGYFPEIQQNLFSRFRVEHITGYEVREDFPRIAIEHVSSLIQQMKYSIDLSGCSQYKVKINEILV